MPTNAIDPEVARTFVAQANAKIDAVLAKLDSIPEDQRVVHTFGPPAIRADSDGSPVPPPTPQPAPSPQAAAGAPPPDVTFAPPPRAQRTNAEIFDRVGAFLDPTQVGPLFVSEPIRRRVFIGKYPSFAEILSSERILGPTPSGASSEIAALWGVAGELGVAIKGYLFAHDPGIEQIRAHPGEPAKWPALRSFNLANNRDPNLTSDIVEIWKQYVMWKVGVTPTEEELEKYYGLI